MIRSDDNTPDPAERPGVRNGKCWNSKPGTQTIRLETEHDGKFVFPYFHFVSGHLEEADDGKELLTLCFPSHKVEIRGKRLEPLLTALDDLALVWVRVPVSRYAALVSEGSPVVTEIAVRSLEGNEIED